MKELWKDIEGYEGLYMVSSEGRVKSLARTKRAKSGSELPVPETIIKQQLKRGYLTVCLSDNGKRKYPLVHCLVAQAFLPNPNNLPQVNHKNEDKTDNRVENLEWCDAKYNNNYGTRVFKTRAMQLNRKDLSKQVIQYDLEGNVIKDNWTSTKEIQRVLGYSASNISLCCNGHPKHKTANGYIWRYKEKETV